MGLPGRSPHPAGRDLRRGAPEHTWAYLAAAPPSPSGSRWPRTSLHWEGGDQGAHGCDWGAGRASREQQRARNQPQKTNPSSRFPLSAGQRLSGWRPLAAEQVGGIEALRGSLWGGAWTSPGTGGAGSAHGNSLGAAPPQHPDGLQPPGPPPFNSIKAASTLSASLPLVVSFAFPLPCSSSLWAAPETSREATESAGHPNRISPRPSQMEAFSLGTLGTSCRRPLLTAPLHPSLSLNEHS